MKNNDVLRRLRYTYDINDTKMIDLFAKGGEVFTRAEISDWLKKDEDEAFKPINDKNLAVFLNGFIIDKRGTQDGKIPEPEKQLNNNLILRKLKIALSLRDEDMVKLLELADIRCSKHEINAFFRSPGQSQYRECKDQFLRSFIYGLQIQNKRDA